MKCYLADILTLARFIVATALLLVALFDAGVDAGVGFILFVLAETTDAFDGTFSVLWPFPPGKAPAYRRHAATYDMVADALTMIAAVLFFTLRVNWLVGLIIIIGYGSLAVLTELTVYGHPFFGHPDNYAPGSLIDRNFPLAKKIIMLRRTVYLLLLALIAIWMLIESPWDTPVKLTIGIAGGLFAVFLWFFLSERRQHISRNAIKQEEKLEQKSGA
jgi:hypothetical protein